MNALHKARTRLNKWKGKMISSGIALIATILAVLPFLEGHPLHRYFESVGKYFIYLCVGLLSLFVISSALTNNLWSYWRSLKAENPSGGG
jgi:multisubunit Na+/H+ antiporter MnhB subunit